MKPTSVISALLALLLAPRVALGDEDASGDAEAPRVHAPSPGADGVYGRLDGVVAVSLAAGAELEAGEPRGVVRLAGHYLWTAGVYARYSDAFGHAEERPLRVASLGVELRPLFLPRFALDLERGPATLDLALDSLSLSAGAYFAEPRRDEFADERGFETGLGLGLPLLSSARGLWLETRAERRFADRGENAWLFSVSLAWHELTWTTETAR